MTEVAAAPRAIWHSDFLLNSSVVGVAAKNRWLYERLALQLHRMTRNPQYGKAWIPWTAFYEMIVTPDPARRDVLGVVVNLNRELDQRIVLTGSLEETIEAEWTEKPHVVSRSIRHLEEELIPCIRGDGAGTMLNDEARQFAEWRRSNLFEYEERAKKFVTAYRADESFSRAIGAAMENAKPPAIYDACDDVASQLIEQYAHRDRDEGLRLAKAEPTHYLATWTFALLFRIAQFAQTIPPQDRARGPFGAYAKLLKSDKNDMTDANIAALGARCGFLITEDSNLRERINFLHAQGACRLQAFEFRDVEANWNEPGV